MLGKYKASHHYQCVVQEPSSPQIALQDTTVQIKHRLWVWEVMTKIYSAAFSPDRRGDSISGFRCHSKYPISRFIMKEITLGFCNDLFKANSWLKEWQWMPMKMDHFKYLNKHMGKAILNLSSFYNDDLSFFRQNTHFLRVLVLVI